MKNPLFHALTKHIEVHNHFFRERILSSEVELSHVSPDRQVVDIFTKPLGLDKLQQFSGAMSVQYLNLANLRGRIYKRNEKDDREAKWNTNFKSKVIKEVELHGTATKAKTQHKRSHHNEEPKLEATENVRHRHRHRQTQLWADVMKGFENEEELETANSTKRTNQRQQIRSNTKVNWGYYFQPF